MLTGSEGSWCLWSLTLGPTWATIMTDLYHQAFFFFSSFPKTVISVCWDFFNATELEATYMTDAPSAVCWVPILTSIQTPLPHPRCAPPFLFYQKHDIHIFQVNFICSAFLITVSLSKGSSAPTSWNNECMQRPFDCQWARNTPPKTMMKK